MSSDSSDTDDADADQLSETVRKGTREQQHRRLQSSAAQQQPASQYKWALGSGTPTHRRSEMTGVQVLAGRAGEVSLPRNIPSLKR
eukprot:SAG31_NODE_2884_length_4954_cov_2.669619_10_plen_86_part_00